MRKLLLLLLAVALLSGSVAQSDLIYPDPGECVMVIIPTLNPEHPYATYHGNMISFWPTLKSSINELSVVMESCEDGIYGYGPVSEWDR